MCVYNNYEKINENDFWRLTLCPRCGALLYKYETKTGNTICVSVLEGMTFHRYGNNNNYVAKHECGYDEGQKRNNKYYINMLEVSKDVKEKVKDGLQQQAIMKVLTDFSKKNVRSNFKKSMLEQAMKFLRSETEYKNPFSPKQVFCIISDMITNEPKIKTTPKKHIDLDLKKHVLTFESGNVLSVNDIERTSVIKIKQFTFTRNDYWKVRADIIEYLCTCDYKITYDGDTNNYYINDVTEA